MRDWLGDSSKLLAHHSFATDEKWDQREQLRGPSRDETEFGGFVFPRGQQSALRKAIADGNAAARLAVDEGGGDVPDPGPEGGRHPLQVRTPS